MTPLQTLVHIKDALARSGYPLPDNIGQLLAAVDLPPEELNNLNDPEAWAAEWAKRHPAPGIATVYAWLFAAMSTAYRAGSASGRVDGVMQERQQRTAAHQLMVERLTLVGQLLERGTIRNVQLRGDTEGAPPRSLAALVGEALDASEGL